MTLVQARQQTLLLDADDTLWENNVYFERAIMGFITFLDHKLHSPAEVRERLNAIELQTIAEHGYGTKSFSISLMQCFRDLSERLPSAEQQERILHFANSVAAAEINLIDGVQESLQELAKDHRLILVTKGNQLEQTQKLERSGLQRFFAGVEVLEEKNTQAYLEIARRYACQPDSTWMIGNSPRSDVNPALSAGFHAVLIPHSATWILEEEEVMRPCSSQRLLVLERLSDLPAMLQDLCS